MVQDFPPSTVRTPRDTDGILGDYVGRVRVLGFRVLGFRA